MRDLGKIVSNLLCGQVDWSDHVGNGTYRLNLDCETVPVEIGALLVSAASDTAMLDTGDCVVLSREPFALVVRPRRDWSPTNGHDLIDTGYTESDWPAQPEVTK